MFSNLSPQCGETAKETEALEASKMHALFGDTYIDASRLEGFVSTRCPDALPIRIQVHHYPIVDTCLLL